MFDHVEEDKDLESQVNKGQLQSMDEKTTTESSSAKVSDDKPTASGPNSTTGEKTLTSNSDRAGTTSKSDASS